MTPADVAEAIRDDAVAYRSMMVVVNSPLRAKTPLYTRRANAAIRITSTPP